MSKFTNMSSEEQCEKKPGYQAVLTSLDLMSLLLGQPMSARLLWITITSKQPDILNLNLALFYNLFYCLTYFHIFIIFFFPLLLSQLHKIIFVYVQVGGPMQLCSTCLERFIAVIHPTYFPLLKKYKCREICAALVWLVSVPLAVMYVFTETFEKLEVITDNLPISLMAVLSVIMLYTSFQVARALRNSPVGKASVHPAKKRAFITICVTSVTAMTCYIPVMVIDNFKFVNETWYNCKLVPLCIFFLSIASLVQPLFYLYAKGEFSRWRCCKKPS